MPRASDVPRSIIEVASLDEGPQPPSIGEACAKHRKAFIMATSSADNGCIVPNGVALDARLLAEVVDLIIASVPTVAIYLFGSYARGEANENSDIDLYVVTDDEARSSAYYAAEARSAVFERLYREGYDFDLIARPRNVFESARLEYPNVEYYVSRDGVKLYG